MARKSPVAQALRACRAELRLTQADFAAWLGLSTQTIVRWENEMRSAPRTAQRVLVVHRVLRQRPDLAGPLAKAWGVELPEASPPAPQAPAVDEDTLSATVYRAAEDREVPAARFRSALAKLVAQWSEAGWSTKAIAASLVRARVKAAARAPR